MCGRYVQSLSADELMEQFDLVEPPSGAAARYNIAPSQPGLVVRRSESGRRAEPMRWGLVPFWADDPSIGSRLINARSETVVSKPAFRAAMRHRRCLVPATGFYEWKPAGGAKQPYYIHRGDGRPLAFAGLYEHWTGPDGERVDSYVILTTAANDAVRPLHDRMPVVLAAEALEPWLDATRTDAEQAAALLGPCAPHLLAMHPVSRRVNRPAVDEPSLIEPIERQDTMFD